MNEAGCGYFRVYGKMPNVNAQLRIQALRLTLLKRLLHRIVLVVQMYAWKVKLRKRLFNRMMWLKMYWSTQFSQFWRQKTLDEENEKEVLLKLSHETFMPITSIALPFIESFSQPAERKDFFSSPEMRYWLWCPNTGINVATHMNVAEIRASSENEKTTNISLKNWRICASKEHVDSYAWRPHIKDMRSLGMT